MNLEYMFFDETLRDRFVGFLAERGIASRARHDEIEGFVVELDGELADADVERIEAEYETLMDEQMILAESKEGWVSHRVAGVTVALDDGRSCMVRLPGALARRLLEHFTAEEVHDLVQAIARNVENPLEGPLCRKA